MLNRGDGGDSWPSNDENQVRQAATGFVAATISLVLIFVLFGVLGFLPIAIAGVHPVGSKGCLPPAVTTPVQDWKTFLVNGLVIFGGYHFSAAIR